MINKITLENFKAFREAVIEIKPITILVGPNNGGKSSLLQSICLIQQTLKGSETEVLNFRDPLNLGDFDNLVHQNSQEKEMRFKFDFEEGKYFDVKIGKEQGKVVIKNFSCNNGEFEYILEKLNEKKDNSKEKSKFFEAGKSRFHPKAYADLIKLRNIKPVLVRDTLYFKIRPAIEDFMLESNTIKEWIESNSKDKDAKLQINEFLQSLYNLERISSDFYSSIKQKFEKIKYIGPIRALAERSGYDKKNFNDVGVMGEHAVQVMSGDSKVQDKVEEYFREMEIANSLKIEKFDNQKNLELKLKTKITDKFVNFADTGCGTSQILPIIVQSLISQEESLTLIEQPEVHLHPKVQADLADFFVKVASKDRRFLIETHSDYFIERIRYGIMDGTFSIENLAIYYIEQDEAEKSSTARKIDLNSKGQYSNLPERYVTNFRLQETRNMTKKLLEKI